MVDLPEKINISTFLITINSNQTDIPSEGMKDAFRTWYKSWLKSSLIFRNDDSPDVGWEKIKSVKIRKAGVEVGGKFKRMHIHAIIQFRHTTNLTMNVPAISKIFTKLFGMEQGSCYVTSRFVRDDVAVTEEYSSKDGDLIEV